MAKLKDEKLDKVSGGFPWEQVINFSDKTIPIVMWYSKHIDVVLDRIHASNPIKYADVSRETLKSVITSLGNIEKAKEYIRNEYNIYVDDLV